MYRIRVADKYHYKLPQFQVQFPPFTFRPIVCRKRPLVDFWKKEVFNSERRIKIKTSQAKTNFTGCRLKRLQRYHVWKSVEKRKERRDEMSTRFLKKKERQEFKMSRKKKMYMPPTKCPLWNCDRPRGLRRNNLLGMDALRTPERRKRCRSRISVLSDLSRRSRTPIITLCSSPRLNERGFKTDND